jgi:hypothetical protein
MTRIVALLLAFALASSPALAQEPVPAAGSKPLVKYGKWLLTAGALGMNYLAARAHDRADDNFDALEQRCLADHALCDLDASGRYADAQSEAFYQTSLRYDRQARRWLFGGETALAGAAALFVWELTRHTPKPDNIPFEPEIRSLPQATGVGFRLAF